MAKHHIVQEKYLQQWADKNKGNLLSIYLIPEVQIIQKTPKWKGFWRKNYNVLDDEGVDKFLPEKVTEIIDSAGIKAIREIDTIKQNELTAETRNSLAHYIALQYIRTPRYREESNKLISEGIKLHMSYDIDSPEKITTTKQDLLNEKPKDQKEALAIAKLLAMSDEEFKKTVYDSLFDGDVTIGLNKVGQSKSLIKLLPELSKEIHGRQWVLVFSKNNNFFTSDNPCFTISNSQFMNGLLSPTARVIFPLRPNLCVYVNPGINSTKEVFMEIDESGVKELNALILKNSYQCVVSEDLKLLDQETKTYNHQTHRKSRDVKTYKKGDYTLFNIE